MLIPIKTSRDFEITLNQLSEKYGEDFEILNGFHESQMNFSDFINGFIDKKIADVTIDANANASNKDIRSLMSEKGKSLDKLFAFNKIFYELKKKYNLRTAREWLETEYSGGFYLHDAPSSSFMPYCYAYDLTRLAREGLFFINNYNNEAPKHLTTFLDDVIEYISFFCNRSSGAVGIPNILVWSFYFWKKDCENGYVLKDPDYYIRQSFQKLIYRLNQPFLRIDQSAFVNVSIFDRYYIESLFGGMEYPDGTFVIDYVDELIEHQKVFMEVVSDIRNSTMFTFPVITYSLLKRDDITEEESKEMIRIGEYNVFVDAEFARWCSDHNTKWNDANFFMSEDVGTLSNCCFGGDQLTLTKIGDNVNYMNFRKLFNKYCNEQLEIFHEGQWLPGRVIRLPRRKMFKITTENKKEFIVTDNHIFPTLKGDRLAINLTTDDVLIFNKSILDGDGTNNNLGYLHGILLSLFILYGSPCPEMEEKQIEFKIPKSELKNIIDYIHNGVWSIDSEALLSMEEGNEYTMISVTSNQVADFIEEYTSAFTIFDMKCLLEDPEFRIGIIYGFWINANGLDLEHECDSFVISNKTLKDQIEAIYTSLGRNISYAEAKFAINQGASIYSIFETDSIKPLNSITNVKESIKSIEESKHCDRVPYAISSIEEYDYEEEFVYCFQMEDENNPYFTLPNGAISHNCRLLSDTKKLNAFINSIGGTALSIGSVKVNTINLMRIALETRNSALAESTDEDEYKKLWEESYLELLRKRAVLCCKTLDIVRHIIQRNIEKGLLPNYCDGGIELDKQYCTIGILGTAEVMDEFGYLVRDDFDPNAEDGYGGIKYTDDGIRFASKIFEVLNDVKDHLTDEYSFNIESVPAERAAVILCQKDNLIYDRNDRFIYSNQWIALTEKCSLHEKLRVSSILDAKCSGGAIAHINLENNFPSTDMAWDMLNKIALQDVIYFAFNTRINECENHHGFVGSDHCPHCGGEVYDTYQRIVGFLVPSRSYSKDRFREFNARKWYGYADSLRD